MNTHIGPFLICPERHKDPRGSMGILQDNQIPFKILRMFWLYHVPENTRRGGHAHRTSKQLLLCLEGTIDAQLEDINGRLYQFQLVAHQQGLYLPPLCWGHFTFHQNAKALCLASDHFDETDYIRDYEEFEQLKYAFKDG